MKIYTVHRRSRGILIEPDMQFVREGFCWGAAIFGFVWALWHRMWWTALGLFVVQAAVGLGLRMVGVGSGMKMLAMLTLALVIGWCADELRRASLDTRGFAPMGVVAADSLSGAEQRYFEQAGVPA